MKKIALSIAALSALCATSSFAADSLETAFKDGNVSGQIRAFYINRNYVYSNAQRNPSQNFDRSGLALGGKLGYETAPLYGISAGVAFYTTNDMMQVNPVAKKNDTTILGRNSSGMPQSITYLGQAYAQGTYGKTLLKVGRQALDTPLAGPDDARMTPTLFQAALLVNSDLPSTTLIAAQVTAIAYGTFANGYVNTGELAVVSGYGAESNMQVGTYQPMSYAALSGVGNLSSTAGSSVANNGVSVFAAVNKSVPNLTLQAWDYVAQNILNAVYAQGDYAFKNMINTGADLTASVQYINEGGIGNKLAGNVNSQYWGGQLAGKYSGFSLTGAYSATGNNTSKSSTNRINLLSGDIITPWAGMPAFTQGMVTRHMFFNNTSAFKVSAGYSLKDMLGLDITPSAYYAAFSVKSANSYTNKEYTTEPGFDITYNNALNVKNFQLRLRGNFPNNFQTALPSASASASPGQTTGWSEYRVIANYSF